MASLVDLKISKILEIRLHIHSTANPQKGKRS